METTQPMIRKEEKGFTLVELAVVMIIIGLLIGGILKGQELIANAQVAATVAQVKAIDAASTTFRDKFDDLPGDMAVAGSTRMPNCVNECDSTGNGDGRLTGGDPLAAPAGVEQPAFFPQLAAADLLGGVANNNSNTWGDIYPEAEIEGGFMPAYFDGGAALGGNATPGAGHYLSLVLTAGAPGANDTLTPNEAFRIDSKIDDGSGNSGSVFAGDAVCQVGGVYAEANQGEICDLAIRFQQ